MKIDVDHVGLTVLDLDKTVAFFSVLGFEVVGGFPDYPAVFVKNGETKLTLWQATDPSAAVAFDRKANVGLHHLALRVDADVLDKLSVTLSALDGCSVEFPPENVGQSEQRHMMVRIPGSGIRLELRSEC